MIKQIICVFLITLGHMACGVEQTKSEINDKGLDSSNGNGEKINQALKDPVSIPKTAAKKYIKEETKKELSFADLLTKIPKCSKEFSSILYQNYKSAPKKNSNGYKVPSSGELLAFRTALKEFLNKNLSNTLKKLKSAHYTICKNPSPGSIRVLFEPSKSYQGRSLIVLNLSEKAKPVILGSPHNHFDGTAQESSNLYRLIGPRALIYSVAHRCSNKKTSKCNGKTTVCSGSSSEPYPNSDMAHTVESFYQVAHEVLADHFKKDWVISIHGMAKQGVSISDGTGSTLTEKHASILLAKSLMKVFPKDNITSCNKGPSIKYFRHLCGSTNTQGRYVNFSKNSCSLSSKTPSGRFIHMEQGRSIRSQADKVAKAILDALKN